MGNVVKDIPLQGATLDRSSHPMLTQGFPRLSGVDLRPNAGFRKFPGFVRSTFYQGTLYTTPSFLKYVELQKAGSDAKLRGYVVLGTLSTTTYLRFHYFDTSALTWNTVKIDDWTTSTGGDADDVDATTYGKYLYVTYRDGTTWHQKVVYYDTVDAAVQVETFGVGKTDSTAIITVNVNGAAGLLDVGTFGVAFRFRHKRRGTRTGMSKVISATTTVASSYIVWNTSYLTTVDLPTDWDADEVEIEFYRTVVGGGVLRFERKLDYVIPATATWRWGDATTGLTDTQLVNQDLYQQLTERVGLVPDTNRILNYQGCTLMRLDGLDTGSDGVVNANTDIVFSPPYDTRPEDFPRTSVYRVPSSVGEVVSFVEAGDYAIAFTPVAAVRFHKNGTQMEVNTFHFGKGPSSRYGAVAVGNSVLIVTTKGVYVMNAVDGELVRLSTVSRLVTHENEWVQDIADDLFAAGPPNIHCVHDEALGCVYIVNNAKKQALCLWTESNQFSMLDDFAWTLSAQGPDLVKGGARRAWFWAPNGSGAVDNVRDIWRADDTRADSAEARLRPTYWGFGDGTHANGTYTGVTGAAMSVIRDAASGRILPVATDGAYAHIWVGTAAARERAVVTGLGTVVANDDFDDPDAAANNTVGASWVERETGATDIRKVSSEIEFTGVGVGATDPLLITNTAGMTQAEEYSVSALFRCHNYTTATPVFLLSVERKATDWTADTEGYFVCWNPTSSAVTMDANSIAANSIVVLRQATGVPGAYTAVGSQSLSATHFTTANLNIHVGVRFEVRVLRSGGSTVFKVLLDGSLVATITDAAAFATATWYAGVGMVGLSGVDVLVDEFRFRRNLGDLNLAAVTSGTQTSGNQWSLSPIPTLVTFPQIGDGVNVYTRTLITHLALNIKNLTSPTPTTNSRVRMQGFVDGSTTEETGAWVTLTETLASMYGYFVAAGMGVAAGFEHYGAGQDFELIGARIHGILGDTSVDD